MEENNERNKMTLDEYKEKYTRPENTRLIKTFLFVFAGSIGIIVAVLLTLLTLRLFDINQYAGYAGIAVSIILFIFLYLVPVIKISRTKAFIVNVNDRTAKQAQKHNRMLRNEISDMMIDYNQNVEGATWYNEGMVKQLVVARKDNNDQEVKSLLSQIYNSDVKKQSDKIIRNCALKVGFLTALSQSDRIDTLLVISYELNMIKNIIYLYGFRPSNEKLMKIYVAVIRNALIAYGSSNVSSNFVTSAANAISEALGARHALGNLIASVVGGATSGIINGSLSVIIGFQTRKYLMNEYHLQNVLDTVEIPDEEQAKMLSEVKSDIVKAAKKKSLTEVPA